MTDKANDLVISYTVTGQGQQLNHETLQTALDSGYRVVDVVPTANTVGGVVITVLVSKPDVESLYQD